MDTREKLAEYSHDVAWAGWMQYMLDQGTFNPDGTWTMHKKEVERWSRQMTTEYKHLSEREKASDREQADKMLAIIRQASRHEQGAAPMTDTTRPRKIVVAGACVMGDCDCRARDGLRIDGSHIPPFHDGCTCYMVEILEAAPTQPKPGRALDERMAKIMGWNAYKATNLKTGKAGAILIFDGDTAREWNPSHRIAHAFEVMDSLKGWRWSFVETSKELSIALGESEFPFRTINILVPQADFTDPNGTRSRPEAYAFGICWAAKVWLEAQKDAM